MTTELPPSAERSSSGCLRASLAAGCGCLVIIVAIVFAGVWWMPGAIKQFADTIAKTSSERDRLISEALAGGDAAVAYERADERFRAQYTQEQLADYLASNPAVLNPPKFSVSFSSQTRKNQTVVHTSFELNDTRYVVYAAKENDQFRLLGIAPDLDGAVPESFSGGDDFDPGVDFDDEQGLF